MLIKLLTRIAPAFLLLSIPAFAAYIVEAPLTLAATVTAMNQPVPKSSGVSVSETVIKIRNAEILKECVRRKIISPTSGWSLVCYYDAQMEGVFVQHGPRFRLRHKNGRTASLDSIVYLESAAGTTSGKVAFKNGKASGSFAGRGAYYLIVEYQGYTALCAGMVPIKLNVSGTKSKYRGIANPTSANFSGYLDGFYYSLVEAKLSLGAFKKF